LTKLGFACKLRPKQLHKIDSTPQNVAFQARASGHRFRVNDIVCHPVLPLLLTTSHHNVVRRNDDDGGRHDDDDELASKDEVRSEFFIQNFAPTCRNFCANTAPAPCPVRA
jgi:hypothetical protein